MSTGKIGSTDMMATEKIITCTVVDENVGGEVMERKQIMNGYKKLRCDKFDEEIENK